MFKPGWQRGNTSPSQSRAIDMDVRAADAELADGSSRQISERPEGRNPLGLSFIRFRRAVRCGETALWLLGDGATGRFVDFHARACAA